MTTAPTLVVVGHVNKGKSSVVATLTEDDTVPIDRTPGTTRRSGEYALELDGQVVLRLIDTPGFQDAPAALEWMKARSKDASDRARVVADFAAEFRGRPEFEDETDLLGRLTGDAGILYVVDCSRPYRPVHEAEMEILRWTGRPGMALLNRIGEQDHAGDWKPVLRQFFHVVREFDAHRAGFDDRLRLLRAFGEVHDEWRAPVDEAVAALEHAETERHNAALRTIAGGVLACLSHVERQSLGPDEDPASHDAALRDSFHETLRHKEQRTREQVERLYRHHRLGGTAPGFELLSEDLFSETSFQLFGLTRPQLAIRGAAWGAAAGAVLDLMVGGLSFATGAILGGIFGGGTAWIGSQKVARAWGNRSERFRRLFPGEVGHYRCFGPVTSPRFAWVLLDRALVHLQAVRARAHARRDDFAPPAPGADSKAGIAHRFPAELQKQIDRLLISALDDAKHGRKPDEQIRRSLAELLLQGLTTD